MPATNVQSFSGDVEITSNLEVGTANLFVDTLTSNVGIGTTTPGQKLSVYTGSTDAAALSFDRFASGNYRTDIYQNAYGPDFRVGYDAHTPSSVLYLKRFSNGSKEVEIDGNVGIGTDNPEGRLTIGPSSSLLFADNRGSSTARNWAIRVNNTAEGQFQIGNDGTNTGGLPDFYANPSHAKITLSHNGLVGVQKTNPGYTVDVNGNMNASSIVRSATGFDENSQQYYVPSPNNTFIYTINNNTAFISSHNSTSSGSVAGWGWGWNQYRGGTSYPDYNHQGGGGNFFNSPPSGTNVYYSNNRGQNYYIRVRKMRIGYE